MSCICTKSIIIFTPPVHNRDDVCGQMLGCYYSCDHWPPEYTLTSLGTVVQATYRCPVFASGPWVSSRPTGRAGTPYGSMALDNKTVKTHVDVANEDTHGANQSTAMNRGGGHHSDFPARGRAVGSQNQEAILPMLPTATWTKNTCSWALVFCFRVQTLSLILLFWNIRILHNLCMDICKNQFAFTDKPKKQKSFI